MAADKEKMILGQKATLFRDEEHPIYLLPDGRFAVFYLDKWVAKRTVNAIGKLIAKPVKTLKIFSLSDQHSSHREDVTVIDAQDYQDNRIIDGEGKKRYKGYHPWYIYDDKVLKEVQAATKELNKAIAQFNQRHKKATRNLKQVSTYNFKQLRDGTTVDKDSDYE